MEKEERGNKGAALTTFISLAGRFLVLMPNNPRAGGVSRRIEGEDRDQMREAMNGLQIPDGMGAIVRTAGVGRTTEELQWDLNNLKTAWDAIVAANDGRPAPFLIFQESDAVTRGLRDYFSDDVGECLIDQPEAFQKAQEYMQRFMPPDAQRKLKLYQDPVPLFTRYQIESQIESAYSHKVTLPSGGSLVIDHTEALVSIDINSARSTRGGDIEATARNTNLEAAEEIARQLRLRDIGGLIVIDFIDMESHGQSARGRRHAARRGQDGPRPHSTGTICRASACSNCRASACGPRLSETTHINCPRCSGMGTIRGVESMSLALLRLIGEEARKERTGRVIAQVPVDVATYLMNEKRDWLNQIESRDKVSLVIVPNPHMQTPAYTLRRIRDDEKELPENTTVSYQLADQPSIDDSNIGNRDKKPQGDVPLVPSILPASAAPIDTDAGTCSCAVAARPRRRERWCASGAGCSAAALSTAAKEAASTSTQTQRNRPAHRDARHDRYRSGGSGDRDRNRDRGDRDRNRDVRRDGPRDPRRDGRPRGENRSDAAPRRPEGPCSRIAVRALNARTHRVRTQAPARSSPNAQSRGNARISPRAANRRCAAANRVPRERRRATPANAVNAAGGAGDGAGVAGARVERGSVNGANNTAGANQSSNQGTSQRPRNPARRPGLTRHPPQRVEAAIAASTAPAGTAPEASGVRAPARTTSTWCGHPRRATSRASGPDDR